jgi:sterol desaturase/sphingolipid hydroxylase (fatty acid hydroxylase superfamily)
MEWFYSLQDSLSDWFNALDPRLAAHLLQIARLSVWLVLLAVIFAPLERFFAIHPKKLLRKAVVTDLGYYFLNSLVPSLLLGVPLAFVAWLVHSYIPVGFTNSIAALPLIVRIAASLFIGEIGFYWGHRWSHEIPLLWRFHAVHHSAEHIDFLVSTRAHPIDMVFTRICGLIPLYILGLATPLQGRGGLIPVFVILVGTTWGFFIHANVKWRFGPLEWIVSTPAFHHWHHTNDGPEFIDKNYAPMYPIIDKIFGTLYLPKDKHPQTYGIDQPVSPILAGQLIEPFLFWRKAPAPTPVPTSKPAPPVDPLLTEPLNRPVS